MGNPFVGEIRMAGFNFTPVGFLPCDGSLQSISQYEVLYTLLGTTYGGDGQTTFGLPNLKSRVMIHQGSNGDGNTYALGQFLGSESVTLTTQQMGAHTHSFVGSGVAGHSPGPAGAYPAGQINPTFYSVDTTPANQVPLAPNSTVPVGGNLPHNNIMPYLCVNFVIASEGVFPSQN